MFFLEDKCGLIFPILDPYSSHMALPMWVKHGTLLQIPHESLMGCPCRTHINTHLGPMWVLYFLLAGMLESKTVSSMDAGMHVPNHVDLRIVTESGKQNKKRTISAQM